MTKLDNIQPSKHPKQNLQLTRRRSIEGTRFRIDCGEEFGLRGLGGLGDNKTLGSRRDIYLDLLITSLWARYHQRRKLVEYHNNIIREKYLSINYGAEEVHSPATTS